MRPATLYLMMRLCISLLLTGCSASAPLTPAAVDACAGQDLCVPLQIDSFEFSGSVDRLQIALEFRSGATDGKSYYLDEELRSQLPFAIGVTFENEADFSLYQLAPLASHISVVAYNDGVMLGVGNSRNSQGQIPFQIYLAPRREPSCNDNGWDGDETGIDCGGSCTKCNIWGGCKTSSDCYSSVCGDGLCRVAPCENGIRDGDEGDVDCGGSCKNKCADTKGCQMDADCKSNFCVYGHCNSADCGATDYAGLDVCGDGCYYLCSTGKHCQSPFDCSSRHCVGGLCQAPSCSDHLLNGNESDIDCGGGSCPACENGKRGLSVDCQSAFEQGGICRPATCGNKKLDPDETDIDCGGACQPCFEGSHCKVAADCVSFHCVSGFCADHTCSDGIQNGYETGIDCGGTSGCGPCSIAVGLPCTPGQWPEDCRSGLTCQAEPGPVPWAPICRRNTCGDTQLSAGESDVDCGGSECTRCSSFRRCLADSDCVSNVCKNGRCQSPLCNDGVKNGLESDIDCGGTCTPCATGQSCNNNFDCGSAKCDQDRCS